MGILNKHVRLDELVLNDYIRETFKCLEEPDELIGGVYRWCVMSPTELFLPLGSVYAILVPGKQPVLKWVTDRGDNVVIPVPIRTPRQLDNLINWITMQDWTNKLTTESFLAFNPEMDYPNPIPYEYIE